MPDQNQPNHQSEHSITPRAINEPLRSAFAHAPIGLMLADLDGHPFQVNPAYCEITGYSSEEILSQDFLSVTHPDDLPANIALITQLRTDDIQNFDVEERFVRKDGIVVWIHSTVTLVSDESNTPLYAMALIQNITDQMALREEQTKHLEQTRARAEREILLNQISQAIRTTNDLEQIQKIATEALGNALHVDRCYFSLYDLADDFRWIGEDFRRPDLPSLAGEYRISDYQIRPEEHYQIGKTLAIDDSETWPLPEAFVIALRQLRVRAFAAVPLFEEQRLVATLSIAMADETRIWTAEELTLLEAVATQTRAAVEAARIVQRDHKIAVQLQDALLPDPPPDLPGLTLAHFYKPALEEAGVGGDFFDVFAAEAGVTFLAVGDVSGKGLEAASQVATLRNMLRFALYNYPTLVEALTILNVTLFNHDLIPGFATLFVGRYDSKTQTLTYVNCGQEPGLVKRAATNQIDELDSTGPVLGASVKANYQDATVVLNDGDVLAIFTDGLTEAGPVRTALLDVSGVASLMQEHHDTETAQAIVSRLIAGVDKYAGDGTRDDVCLLVGIISPVPAL